MLLKENEVIDNLNINNLKIIQNNEEFKYGTDAVALSKFANIKNGGKVLDLCTGSGIIPILLCGLKNPKKIVGVEIQKFPHKMNYYYKESLDTSGMTLLVEYSDGTSEPVSSGYTVPATTFKTTGAHKITVTYQGFTDDFTVSVTYAWWQILIRIILLGFLWY